MSSTQRAAETLLQHQFLVIHPSARGEVEASTTTKTTVPQKKHEETCPGPRVAGFSSFGINVNKCIASSNKCLTSSNNKLLALLLN